MKSYGARRLQEYKLILLFFISMLVGCDYVDSKFTIVNNSSQTVSFYFSKDSSGMLAKAYYSSLYYKTPVGKTIKDFEYTGSKRKAHVETLGEWGTNTDSFSFNNGVAYIYVIDSINIGKDTVAINHDKLIKRYKVTSEFLKSHGWVLNL